MTLSLFKMENAMDFLKCLTVLLACFCFVSSEPLRFQPQHGRSNDPKQSWGYVDVRDKAHMFYWLYYTTAPAGFQKQPLVMWLQGGPGGSGTGFGNFGEIGPLTVDLMPRNTTWLQSASLLFVDNPVGTGYSYVDDESAYTHDVEGIAEDMMVLLKTFFNDKATDFQEVPFYIFSESYGGKMTAAISQMLYQKAKSNEISCNFKGLAMGDSWISPMESTWTWAPYLYVNSLVDQAGYTAINKSVQMVQAAVDQGQWSEATELWGSVQTQVVIHTNGVNFYNILKWGQEERSSLFAGKKDYIERMLGKLHADPLSQLMNGQIKKKLGIPAKVTWGGQSEMVFKTQSGDFMKPVISIVNDLVENTDLQVVVYTGQLDLIVDTIGTEEWVYTLKVADQFRKANRDPILDPVTKLTSGFVKKAGNFAMYWVLDAGHMIPADNGNTALKMLQMITGAK